MTSNREMPGPLGGGYSGQIIGAVVKALDIDHSRPRRWFPGGAGARAVFGAPPWAESCSGAKRRNTGPSSRRPVFGPLPAFRYDLTGVKLFIRVQHFGMIFAHRISEYRIVRGVIFNGKQDCGFGTDFRHPHKIRDFRYRTGADTGIKNYHQVHIRTAKQSAFLIQNWFANRV